MNFFNIWFGMVQHHTQFGCRVSRKFVKTYRFCRAEENNQWDLLKLFELFFSFVQVRQISLLFVLFHWKSVQLPVQVCCLFTFNFIVHFSKEKKRVGFLLVCITVSELFLKTPGWFFWLSPVTSTLKIIIVLYVIFWVKFQNCPI